MKSSRRDFLKHATVAGAGTFAGGLLSGCAPKQPESNLAAILGAVKKAHVQEFHGDDNIWKKLVELPDLDLIYICTPWVWHTPMAVYAMENGKHVVSEVPISRTIDEAWQLVETSERTKKHCMMLENCCYDFFELLILNIARNGMFGDIVHGEGAYIHHQ